ncbi:unnamed protein product, partial [Closterium sp. NIES-64]
MGFITWSTVTLCLLSTLFDGDTSAAMWQVSQQDPAGNSTTMQHFAGDTSAAMWQVSQQDPQWLPCVWASDVRQGLKATATAISASSDLRNTSLVTHYPR